MNEMIDKNLVIVCITFTLCLLFVLNAFGKPPSDGVLGFAREALAGVFGIVTGAGGAKKVKDILKKSKENKQETSTTK